MPRTDKPAALLSPLFASPGAIVGLALASVPGRQDPAQADCPDVADD